MFNLNKNQIYSVTENFEADTLRIFKFLYTFSYNDNFIDIKGLNDHIKNILNADENINLSCSLKTDNIDVFDFKLLNEICENPFGSLLILDPSEHKRNIVLVANVFVTKTTNAIINFGGYELMKVWVNNDLLASENVIYNTLSYCFARLKKGNNIIIIELFNRLAILKLFKFDFLYNQIEGKLLENCIKQSAENKVSIDKTYSNEQIFTLRVITKDQINIHVNQIIKVVFEDINGCKYYEFETTFYKLHTFYKTDDIFFNNDFIMIKVYYKNKNKVSLIKEDILIFDSKFTKLQERYSKVNELNNHGFFLEQRLSNLYYSMTSEEAISKLKEFNEILNQLENSDIQTDNIIKRGLLSVYYYSDITEKVFSYNIYIPNNYNINKKYPLLILCHHERWMYPYYECYSEYANNNDLIIVSTPPVGVMCGSYIEEAVFFEFINLVLSRYSINVEKIFLIGNSAGGYFAWSLASNFPHMFAGIIILSGGVYEKNIRNLYNVNILNICGEKDFMLDRAMNTPNKHLIGFARNYNTIIAKDVDHVGLISMYFSKVVFDFIEKNSREKYPKKIYYRTERIRHNEAYWIEIIELIPGEYFCELTCEIHENLMELNLVNIKKMCIKTPEFLKGNIVVIKVNGDTLFKYNGDIPDEIYIENNNNRFFISDKSLSVKKSSLGMGILDIYMDRLRVVIPSNLDNNEESIIQKIISNISSPFTMGYNSETLLNYKTKCDKELNDLDLKEYNLILIDYNNKNTLIKKINHMLEIKYNKNSICYKENELNGDYFIMYIQENPLNTDKKILIICSNNLKLMKSIIFLRRIIIPTYSNGFHNFLNCEAIIYFKNKYYGIRSLGHDLPEEIV